MGVPVPEIAKKLTIKVGKNAGKPPSVASLYRALAEAETAAADDGLPLRPKPSLARCRSQGNRGGRPVTHSADLYRDRNTVERAINRMKDWRGIATRHDKTPDSHLAGLHLRVATIWISSLLKTQ